MEPLNEPTSAETKKREPVTYTIFGITVLVLALMGIWFLQGAAMWFYGTVWDQGFREGYLYGANNPEPLDDPIVAKAKWTARHE